MNITSNFVANNAQPNFTAYLKDNKVLRKYISNMSNYERSAFDTVTEKLSNISFEDELELYTKKDEYGDEAVFLHNPQKKKSDVYVGAGSICMFPKDLIKTIKKTLTPNTKETNKLLSEPVTKNQRSIFGRIGDYFQDMFDDDGTNAGTDAPCL